MKQNLFLLAVIFAVLHLCKAGPLRLHKRAAFYIANETACVVDNIVYSNGDPIPTDDPCEACRCRPPGFACVLKECRVKPGCRAVRQVGQCCPDYICGCEHNGKMYQDGEEIRDDKNPCYTCHCQGSSIACAFVDCFFRVDCVPEYVQGECCPRYTNCSRDLPDNNSFDENNNVPSLNLLPVLNDNEYLVPIYENPAPQEPASPEVPTYAPTQPPVVDDRSEETTAPQVKETTTQASVPQTTESGISESEESKLDPVVEDKSTGEETVSSEGTTAELSKDESEDKKVEESEEKVAVLNSETEIVKEENEETTTAKVEDPVEPTKELVKEDEPQTTTANYEEPANDAEATEKPPETESTSTEVPSIEKEVKNSAADNSKSLKLSDDENDAKEVSNVLEKGEETKTEEPEKTQSKSDETVTQSSTESSKTESVDPSESKPEPEENVAEESQSNPQSALYSNDDKIKSESAETVTIVVHVNEKTKLATETDFVSEQVTPEPAPNATQENLLKSNDELKSTEISTEPTEVDKSASTRTNFEVFPSSTETSNKEFTTSSPSTVEGVKEEAEGRSEEAETSVSDSGPTKDESTTDLKSEEGSSVATTTQNEKDVTESIPVEARADEDANDEAKEEKKEDKPGVTIIKIEEPNVSIKIQITTDSDTEVSKSEEPTENVEPTEETKSEESVDEIQPEVKEEADSKPEEKEQTTTSDSTGKTTAEEKVESTSPVTEEIHPEERAAETEPADKEDTVNVESSKPEESQENQPTVTTESRNQATVESTQTETPNNDNE